jgi:hypothetical protein
MEIELKTYAKIYEIKGSGKFFFSVVYESNLPQLNEEVPFPARYDTAEQAVEEGNRVATASHKFRLNMINAISSYAVASYVQANTPKRRTDD